MRVSRIILAVFISSVILAASIFGGYKYGEHKYGEGTRAGIRAVIEGAAELGQIKLYNPESGNGMICQGGHVGDPEKTPEKDDLSPPSPPAGVPEHHNKPPGPNDSKDLSMV